MNRGMKPILFLNNAVQWDASWPQKIADNVLHMNFTHVLLSQNIWTEYNAEPIIESLQRAGLVLYCHAQPGAWAERAGFKSKPYDRNKEVQITAQKIIKLKEQGWAKGFYVDGTETYDDTTPKAFGEESRIRAREMIAPWWQYKQQVNPDGCFMSSAVWQVADLLGSIGTTDQDRRMDALEWAKMRAITLIEQKKVFPSKTAELGWWGDKWDTTVTRVAPLHPLHYYYGVQSIVAQNRLAWTYKVDVARMAQASEDYMRVNRAIGEMELLRSKIDPDY